MLLGAVLLAPLCNQAVAALLPIKQVVAGIIKPAPPPAPLPPLLPLAPLPVLGTKSGLPAPAGALVAQQVAVPADGSVRHYLLHTPAAGTDKPIPLVLVLHGYSQNAQQMADSASGQVWRLMADNLPPESLTTEVTGPFYVAFLNGATPGNLATGAQAIGTWNDCDAARVNNLSTANDVAFAKAVVAQMGNKVDTSKVYAYGMSNGATMALRLGREAGDVIAAIAAVSGVDPQPVNDECNEMADGVQNRRPATIVHGTADLLVSFTNSCVAVPGLPTAACRLGHADTVAAWKSKSGAGFATDAPGAMPPKTAYPKSTSATRPPLAPADATKISCVQHLSKFQIVDGQILPIESSDVRIQDCIIDGGGHLEPSILTYAGTAVEATFGKQNNDAESALLAWQFFRRHIR